MSFHYCVNKINVYGALVHVAWILDLYMLIYASHCSPVVLIDVFFFFKFIRPGFTQTDDD
jgi:hypothetical protein